MRIIYTAILILISIIVKSHDIEQVIICCQKICQCKVYLKVDSTETLTTNDTITYNKSKNNSLVIYYPEETIHIAIRDSFDNLRKNYFLTSIRLLDARNSDGQTYTASLMSFYEYGNLVVDYPLDTIL